jgi:phosphoribosyl 1,2-cyclic phosphodiesterase
MKLTLLGTGAAEGIPGFRCQCEMCSEARIKRREYIRQNSAAYLEGSGGVNILFYLPN